MITSFPFSTYCGLFRNDSCLDGLGAEKFPLQLFAAYRSRWSRFSWCDAADFILLSLLVQITFFVSFAQFSSRVYLGTILPRADPFEPSFSRPRNSGEWDELARDLISIITRFCFWRDYMRRRDSASQNRCKMQGRFLVGGCHNTGSLE